MKNKGIIDTKDGVLLLDGMAIVTEVGTPASGGMLRTEGDDMHRMTSDVRDAMAMPNSVGTFRRITTEDGKTARIKTWGRNNMSPVELEAKIRANHILPSLIDTKRKILLGQRSFMFFERWEKSATGGQTRIVEEVEMPSEIVDFFAASEEHRYFLRSATQLYKNGNVVTEFLPTRNQDVAGTKIAALKAHESKFWRLEEMDADGCIANGYFKGDSWTRTGNSAQFPIKQTPMWDGFEDTNTEGAFLYWSGDDLLRYDDYYYDPTYIGALPFVGLANIVPQFHEANLRHGYLPRFHIRIRKGMFLDPKYFQISDEKEKQKLLTDEASARTAWLKSANDVLAGYQNTGRAIWSEEEVLKGMQKQFPDVEIIALNVNMQDEALLKLFEKANEATISAMQVPPTLANIHTQGKLSSGSDIRNSLLMYRLIHTPLARNILLEPIYIKSKIDGWDKDYGNGRKVQFGFHDEDIVVLSESVTGVAPVE